MIPAYWGQISNRTADPMAFIDVPGSDARSVSIPGDDSVCPLTAGWEGSREKEKDSPFHSGHFTSCVLGGPASL